MKTELKNAFLSWNFLFTVIITAFVFFIGVIEDINSFKTMDILYFFNLCMQLSPLMVFLPFLSALPYGYNFIDEYNSNFFRFSLSRAGRKKYVFNKMISVTLSCFFAVFFGILLCVFLMSIFAQKTNLINFHHQQNFLILKNSRVYGSFLNISVYAYIFIGSFFISLFATLWPSIGMISSTYIKNRYVSLIMPFIAFFLLWQIGNKLGYLIPFCAKFLMPVNVYYGSVGMFENPLYAFISTLCAVLLWHTILALLFYKRIKKCQ